jgi:hypothetical protein
LRFLVKVASARPHSRAAERIGVTIQYVYFGASGAHTRQPRATGSYGGFTPIPGLNPGGTATLAPGTPYQPGVAEAHLSIDSLSLDFAFVNVSGCVEGPRTSFVAGTPPPVGIVGSSPIVVLYVYVPEGGVGNGDSGAVIDAFDASINELVDNNFVTVSPDPGGTLTTEANVDGWVDTAAGGYTIAADHPNIGSYLSLPTSPLFDQWVDLLDPSPPTALVNGANLTPGRGVTVYALAFYHDPVKQHKEIEKLPREYYANKWIAEIIKGPKETVEDPGFGNYGDPEVIAGELRTLTRRIATLESRLEALGTAFIKAEERPGVGQKQR